MFTRKSTTGKAAYEVMLNITVTLTVFGLGYIAVDAMFTPWTPSVRPYIKSIFFAVILMWIVATAIGIRVSYISARQLYQLRKQRR